MGMRLATTYTRICAYGNAILIAWQKASFIRIRLTILTARKRSTPTKSRRLCWMTAMIFPKRCSSKRPRLWRISGRRLRGRQDDQRIPRQICAGNHVEQPAFSETVPEIQTMLNERYYDHSIIMNLLIQYVRSGEVNNLSEYTASCWTSCWSSFQP